MRRLRHITGTGNSFRRKTCVARYWPADPHHLRSLVLLADLMQQSGRNKLAVKMLKQALALDCSDAAAHDTIAIAYQALGRRDDAVRHFAQAVALGLGDAEMLIKQSAAVAAPLKRLAAA